VPPWLPAYSSAAHWDHETTLNEQDADDLRAWGFNVVRLGVMWPGAMPARGAVDAAYLREAKAIVDMLGTRGIYTIVDMHQDLYNRKLCGEGAPDWAVHIPAGKKPFPSPIVNHTYPTDPQGYPELASCLEKTFAMYYATHAVGAAFQSLYENVDGIADELVRFWVEVAKVFRGNEWVLGYELINEPWAGDVWAHPTLLVPGQADKKNLWPLYVRLHEAIR
jgi:endoglycosylceramidase